MTLFTVLCSAVLLGAVVPAWSDKHSLYYIYTALSKPVNLPGIYEFTAMGLLDDRQIDYYNSKEKRKIPTQHWMKEKMQEDYWEKGTQSRKSKEQWFNVNVNILMNRMRDNESDVHVLQWRHGCEIEKQGNELKFSKGIDEYSYDGENFLSFDDKESQWVAPVDAALPTKRKWDNVPILNQYTKGYLEKECVDWLNKFREYGDEEVRNGSPPEVHVSAKRCTSDKTKLKLTCMATGFYPKDMIMTIRKYRTSLPEDDTESTGIRPNHDGTFQQRKSVNIKEDEKAEYDCFVSHNTLKEPVIVKWDGQCKDCMPETVSGMIGAVIGGLLVLAVGAIVVVVLKKKGIIDFQRKNVEEPRTSAEKKPLTDSKRENVEEPRTSAEKKPLTDSKRENVEVPMTGEEKKPLTDSKRENVEVPMTGEEKKPLTGEGHDKTGSNTTISTDSGKGSTSGSKDNSPSNSQVEVNIMCEDSSSED